MEPCPFADCDRPIQTRGYCHKHYMHFMRNNNQEALAPKPTPEDRFWSKVDKTETCWLWTGAPNQRGGYGTLRVKDGDVHRPKYAHRYSYELANGSIPVGMQIDHVCHTPLCVNPDHLRPVDHKQNGENHQGALRTSQSGIRGVYWHKDARKWTGQVGHHGVRYNAGLHSTIAEAEAAVIELRNRLFTHNDIDRIAA